MPSNTLLEDAPTVAFEGFCQDHHAELTRLAVRLTHRREDADDVVSTALSSAWENWNRVATAEVPIAYVRRMVTNLAADQVNRGSRERRRTGLLGPMVAWSYEQPDVTAQLDLRSALRNLPAGQRSCVVLRHLLGYSPDEVAGVLGISPGTVKSQTARGLDQLRKALGTF